MGHAPFLWQDEAEDPLPYPYLTLTLPLHPQDEAEDPFGLDQMLTEARSGKALDKIGEGAGMSAAAGGSMSGPEGSGRSSIGFARERG